MAVVRLFSGRLGTIEVDHFREMFGFWVEWHVLLHPNTMNPYLVWRSLPQFLEGPAYLTWKEFSERHAAEITEWRQYWAPRYLPDVSGVAAYTALQEALESGVAMHTPPRKLSTGGSRSEAPKEAGRGPSCSKDEGKGRVEEIAVEDEISETMIPDGPVPPFNPIEELFAVLMREYGEVRSDKLISLRDFCHLPGESMREAYTRLTDLSRGVLSERQAIRYWLSSLDEELQERVSGMITNSAEDRTLRRVFHLTETALADKLQRSIMLTTFTPLGNGGIPKGEAA